MKKTLLSIVAVATALFTLTSNASVEVPYRVQNAHQALAGDCEPMEWQEPEAFQVNANNWLYLLPCFSGAYNISYRAYLHLNVGAEYESVEPVAELTANAEGKVVTNLILVNPGYDPETRTMGTFAKGRGIGDCGTGSTTVFKVEEYGAISVVTTEVRSKQECDGDVEKEWPVVFQQ